jgi:hypothetical protein
MVATLADFFFIAGLDGLEPAILHPPTTTSTGTATVSRNDSINTAHSPTKEVSPATQETIPEEPRLIPTLITTNIIPESRPTTSSSSIGTKSIPPTPPPTVHVTNTTLEAETESHAFEQVIAKFTSEREDFLSTLAPPSLPRSVSPLRESLLLEEEEEDELSELGAVRSPSPLRPRSSLRSKIVDISRKASRSGTLRRRSTIRTHPPHKRKC